MPPTHYDVVVLGGGAAGLMCAMEAGKRGRSVLVVERNERVGKKILISGGGRCNFTNVNAGPEHYFSENPNFCRSALSRYTPQDFIALVERHGIAYHEKKLGQLFCDGSASQIVEMLVAQCDSAGVEFALNTELRSVTKPSDFEVVTGAGTVAAGAFVVASGGLSIPQIGATGLGYQIARQFGLKLVERRPGLVPLTFGPEEQRLFEAMSGVAVEATVRAGSGVFTENVLFTHRGLSGPAILQASSCWLPGEAISMDILPRIPAREMLESARRQPRELVTVLSEHLPHRFAQAWCAAYAPSRAMARYSDDELDEIAERLQGWQLRPAGTGGYGKAEVTLGGVDTAGLWPKTMEARAVPGLFFVGEVVDVTGWLGGYNFQWAWASGFAAGQVA